MSEKIGVCVVGLGIGSAHAVNLNVLKDNVNLYLCDANPERLKASMQNYRAEGFLDYKEALKRSDIQVMDICLPHHLHCPIAVESAKAGKHVIVEKPMARTLDEADAMLDAASKTNVMVMVAEHHRYISSVIKAKELIDDGTLGDILLIECKLLYGNQNGWPLVDDWRSKNEYRGGGVVLSDAVHRVNVMRTLGGEVASVYSLQPKNSYFDGEDTAVLSLRYINGAIGILPTSWATRLGKINIGAWFSVYGTEGTMVSDSYSHLRVYSRKLPESIEKPLELQLENRNIMLEELKDFVECVMTGRTALVTGLDGRKDIEICLAAYRSEETKQEIKLPL